MCGICGILRRDGQPIEVDLLNRINQAMVHRGPDDEGRFLDGPLGMAMRRLAIIDRAGGRQPIQNEDGSVTVVYNGEIYNYRELTRLLVGRGHHFRTRSDTEVLVHLYEEFGLDGFQRLNGMFAFSLWDGKRRRLVLGRDRTGIKPLVYADTGKEFVWASETRALLIHPSVSRELDPLALQTYLRFYYIPSPRTIFRFVRKLQPGHLLVLENNTSPRLVRFWELPEECEAVPEEEARKALPGLLRAAIERHFQSEVPVGVYLSGGLDSTSIVALASEFSSEPLRTFSIGFQEASYSELDDAEAVASRYNTIHRSYRLESAQVPQILEDWTTRVAEPFGDWSALANYEVSRRAKEEVTVILRGDGGDEVLGGYPTYSAQRILPWFRKIPSPIRRGLLRTVAAKTPASGKKLGWDVKLRAFLRGAEEEPLIAHFRFKEIFGPEEIDALLSDPPTEKFDPFQEYAEKARGADLLRKVMGLDLVTFLEGNGYAVGDLTTMLHSVESRVPFMDNEFFDYGWKLPARYFVRGLRTKALFREAMEPFLPPKVVRAPKRGFVIPGSLWLRSPGNPVHELGRDIVLSDRIQSTGLLIPDLVRRYWKEHNEGRVDRTRALTAVFGLVLWAEKHLV
ncbi:MAG: asparagine synthase (glutamine-hydrolyzing) [Candidatus Hydrogenedentota bacterium]|nr:MAG: asparagine synthase (glutamine-hydrolyzing) [Candidatus Hydrogenedentota bacterium]